MKEVWIRGIVKVEKLLLKLRKTLKEAFISNFTSYLAMIYKNDFQHNNLKRWQEFTKNKMFRPSLLWTFSLHSRECLWIDWPMLYFKYYTLNFLSFIFPENNTANIQIKNFKNTTHIVFEGSAQLQFQSTSTLKAAKMNKLLPKNENSN